MFYEFVIYNFNCHLRLLLKSKVLLVVFDEVKEKTVANLTICIIMTATMFLTYPPSSSTNQHSEWFSFSGSSTTDLFAGSEHE